jgi:hypothetical protein
VECAGKQLERRERLKRQKKLQKERRNAWIKFFRNSRRS